MDSKVAGVSYFSANASILSQFIKLFVLEIHGRFCVEANIGRKLHGGQCALKSWCFEHLGGILSSQQFELSMIQNRVLLLDMMLLISPI